MARAAEPEGVRGPDEELSLTDRRLATLGRGLQIIAVRRLADAADAADAAQESLTRALIALRSRRIPCDVSFEAFVYGILRHVVTDALRRRSRDGLGFKAIDWHVSPDPTALDALIRRERITAVNAALARLSRADRELLRTCFYDGERVVDIARRSDEPPARVRKRKSRALARLRSEMRQGESGPGHTPDGSST